MDGKKILIDWKTSKRVYDNYFLQASAYLHAYEEMTGDFLDGARIISFRDGKISSSFIGRDRCLELFDVFKCARILYKWKYGK